MPGKPNRKMDKDQLDRRLFQLFLVGLAILPFLLPAGIRGGVFDIFSSPGPASIDIREIMRDTEEIIRDARELSEDYVTGSIRRNRRLITGIQEDLEPGFFGPSEEERMEILQDGIEMLRDLYRDLNDRKDSVSGRLRGHLKDITDYIEDQEDAIAKEKKYLKHLEDELYTLIDDYSGKNLDVKQRAIETRILLTRQRITLLDGFLTDYAKLTRIFKKANRQVAAFIFVISVNTKVYEEAFETLAMKKDFKTARRMLNDINLDEGAPEDLMENWEKLMEMVIQLNTQATEIIEAG